MIKEYKIADNKIVETDSQPTITLSISPSHREKDALKLAFKIDEYSLQSALDPMEIPRLEIEPEDDWFLLIFKKPAPYSGNLRFDINTVGVYILAKQKLLIISSLPIELNYSKVKSIYDVVLRLVGSTTNHFRDHLLVMNKLTEEIQNGINTAIVNKHLIELLNLQKTLVYYVDSISSNCRLLEKIRANHAYMKLDEHTTELLDDVIIETNQCLRQAEIYSNILASLMDARASLINNNISVMVKNLTIVTISIMIPTFIVSIFSMNVPIPMQTNHHMFWYILSGMACTTAVLIPFWRRRH